MSSLQTEIAATAAALVVEEGLEYGPAKRRAAKQMGLPARAELPDNAQIEDAVIEYIAVFCADTQPTELAALRELALMWMQRMADFRPHLAGAVWHGTATRLSDIYIQLFCDDSKSAEIALIEHNVDYEPRTVTGFTGGKVEALSLSSLCKPLNENIGVHLMVYDHDDLRGALRLSHFLRRGVRIGRRLLRTQRSGRDKRQQSNDQVLGDGSGQGFHGVVS